jgi:GxxExxY protein
MMHADTFPEREITRAIIGAFFRVYNELGFGFLESVYRRALAHELRKIGLAVEVEVAIDVWYDGIVVGHFRADLLVERRVIVETKASVALVDADRKQVLNYLRATDVEIGLLLHFGPRAAVKRVIYPNSGKASGGRG